MWAVLYSTKFSAVFERIVKTTIIYLFINHYSTDNVSSCLYFQQLAFRIFFEYKFLDSEMRLRLTKDYRIELLQTIHF